MQGDGAAAYAGAPYNYMGQEIERKWLLAEMPAPSVMNKAVCRPIVQGYLCTSPVVRIRRDGDRYYLTYKGKGTLEREEYNLPLTEEAFSHLCSKCDGIILRKDRYEIPLQDSEGLVAELDVFHGNYEGLCYVEVEFQSREQAEGFRAPGWFGREVTEEPGYSNAALSRGIPAGKMAGT